MDKEKSTNNADSKRTERLARLKELHYRRVCIRKIIFSLFCKRFFF